MALGKGGKRQRDLWVVTSDLARSPGHPFYNRLNRILAEAGFDAYVLDLCAPRGGHGCA